MDASPWPAFLAVLGLLVGLGLALVGRGVRRSHGLGWGETASLDRVTLTSPRLGLTGRPDRLIRSDGTMIVEEWKSSRAVRPWHRAQMGVYFLLVEEQLGTRPSHGFLVTGDGSRHRIENDDDLRAWVLDLAEEIRRRRSSLDRPITVDPASWQCRPCGMRDNCEQARA